MRAVRFGNDGHVSLQPNGGPACIPGEACNVGGRGLYERFSSWYGMRYLRARAMPQGEPNLLLPPWLRGETEQNSRCTASELVTVGVPWVVWAFALLARGAFKARLQMLGLD